MYNVSKWCQTEFLVRIYIFNIFAEHNTFSVIQCTEKLMAVTETRTH